MFKALPCINIAEEKKNNNKGLNTAPRRGDCTHYWLWQLYVNCHNLHAVLSCALKSQRCFEEEEEGTSLGGGLRALWWWTPLLALFAAAEEWRKMGGEPWQLIEPVDGFHPSQVKTRPQGTGGSTGDVGCGSMWDADGNCWPRHPAGVPQGCGFGESVCFTRERVIEWFRLKRPLGSWRSTITYHCQSTSEPCPKAAHVKYLQG